MKKREFVSVKRPGPYEAVAKHLGFSPYFEILIAHLMVMHQYDVAKEVAEVCMRHYVCGDQATADAIQAFIDMAEKRQRELESVSAAGPMGKGGDA